MICSLSTCDAMMLKKYIFEGVHMLGLCHGLGILALWVQVRGGRAQTTLGTQWIYNRGQIRIASTLYSP